MDKVRVFGTRKHWVLVGLSGATRTHRVEGAGGRIADDDAKRPAGTWAGMIVGPRRRRGVLLGHSGRRRFDRYRWRARWRRLRHPVASRRPVAPMGVRYDEDSSS